VSIHSHVDPPAFNSLRRTGHERAFAVTLSKDHSDRWHWQVDFAIAYRHGETFARWHRTGTAATRREAWAAAVAVVDDEQTQGWRDVA